MLHGHDRERLVAFYKLCVSRAKEFCLSTEKAVFAIHVELHYSAVIVENKFMVFVVHEQLVIGYVIISCRPENLPLCHN